LLKSLVFNVQYNWELFKEKASNLVYMTGWHTTSAYWAVWQAYDQRVNRPKRMKSLEVAPIEDAPKVETPLGKHLKYTVILTPKGQEMVEDVARINNLVNGVKYTHQQWIAALINIHLVHEHRTALELLANHQPKLELVED